MQLQKGLWHVETTSLLDPQEDMAPTICDIIERL
jgi:hypothetical protein